MNVWLGCVFFDTESLRGACWPKLTVERRLTALLLSLPSAEVRGLIPYNGGIMNFLVEINWIYLSIN